MTSQYDAEVGLYNPLCMIFSWPHNDEFRQHYFEQRRPGVYEIRMPYNMRIAMLYIYIYIYICICMFIYMDILTGDIVNRPFVLKTYFQSPQDHFSKRLEAQILRPSQNWYSSRSQQYHTWTFGTSTYRLNTVRNTSSNTSWRLVSKTGHEHVYENLKL